MYSYNDKENRLIFLTESLGGGLNTARSSRRLSDSESPSMESVLIRTDRVVPSKEAAGSAVYDVDENIHHAFQFRATNITWLIMCQDTKIEVDSTGTAVDKTPSSPFTTNTLPQWQGYSMLNGATPVAVINKLGFDKPHYWDGGAGDFLPLSSAPKVYTIVPYLGCLYTGFVYTSGEWWQSRIQWSDQLDITAWGGATSGYLDLTDVGDAIVRLAVLPGHILMALRQHSVWLCPPTGNPEDPIGSQHLANSGIWAPNSLQPLVRAQDQIFDYIYLGFDDFYMVNQGGAIGFADKIREQFFLDTEPEKLELAWSFIDKRTKDYYLVADLKDGTKRAYIYNYEEKTWAQQDMTGYTCLVSWYAI